MRFVVDVGVGRSVEQMLAAEGYAVLAVRDRDPHLPDADILAWAQAEQAVVITMDKDFGDLVWQARQPHYGVILLRLEEATGPERADVLRRILQEFGPELPGRFAVYKGERLRISG